MVGLRPNTARSFAPKPGSCSDRIPPSMKRAPAPGKASPARGLVILGAAMWRPDLGSGVGLIALGAVSLVEALRLREGRLRARLMPLAIGMGIRK